MNKRTPKPGNTLTEEQKIELIKKYQNGCQESFEKLFCDHKPLIVFIIQRTIVPDFIEEEEVDSVAHEAFFNAARGYDTKRGTKFSYYVSTSISRSLWKYVEKRRFEEKKKKSIESFKYEEVSSSLECDCSGKNNIDSLIETTEMQELRSRITCLSKKIRMVLIMHLQGMSHTEIGKEIGLSRAAVSLRYWRGVRLLKEKYEVTE